MKTITLTDEMYDKLMELSKAINSQNHRHTRMPYIFQVEETKKVPAFDGCGEMEYMDTEEGVILSREEVKEQYFEAKNWELGKSDCEKMYEGLDPDEIAEELELELREFTDQQVYSNAFLTAKACQDHIEANYYHYEQPRVFLNPAIRNSELELVYKFLCELSGGEIHK